MKSRKSKKTRKDPVSNSAKSGINFPVSRIGSMLRRGLFAERISIKAAISMASVLEFVLYEMLEQSMMYMKESKRSRIGSHISPGARIDYKTLRQINPEADR